MIEKVNSVKSIHWDFGWQAAGQSNAKQPKSKGLEAKQQEQDKMAQDLMKREAENIQTKIETLERWTDAESRHQKYYEKKAAKKQAMRRFGQ